MATTTKQIKVKNVPSITSDSSVLEAVKKMKESESDAVVVLENARLAGIFSEHDLMEKVVALNLNPENTKVLDVMTIMPPAIDDTIDAVKAISIMSSSHCHYLPVIDKSGTIFGIVSLTELEELRVSQLNRQNSDLLAYIEADGWGG